MEINSVGYFGSRKVENKALDFVVTDLYWVACFKAVQADRKAHALRREHYGPDRAYQKGLEFLSRSIVHTASELLSTYIQKYNILIFK